MNPISVFGLFGGLRQRGNLAVASVALATAFAWQPALACPHKMLNSSGSYSTHRWTGGHEKMSKTSSQGYVGQSPSRSRTAKATSTKPAAKARSANNPPAWVTIAGALASLGTMFGSFYGIWLARKKDIREIRSLYLDVIRLLLDIAQANVDVSKKDQLHDLFQAFDANQRRKRHAANSDSWRRQA
jgi:hypothetical protein